ncbi:hypothetical protein DFH28DRAFT_1142555 [Melampsora americana]|nr:hypothetical protein DFH28DRAFT_1142555 [Melampsora americana]
MRHTRSQALATSSVARPPHRTTNQSNRPKRKVSIESTVTLSKRKRDNFITRSTRHPVSLLNQDFDDDNDDELEAEGYETEDSKEEEDDGEDDENESEEIFNHLATHIKTNPQRRPNTPNNKPTASEDDDEKEILPTIKEYKDVLDQWPLARIAVVARSQKKKGTAVPPLILTEARAIQKIYKQMKAMLSIMGNISKFTLDKALGELGGRRKPGCYQIWLKYSKEREKHRMPLKGGQKGILANRNQQLGKIWKSLPLEHQEVFHPTVFYVLSGLTPPSIDSDDDDDGNESVPGLDNEPEHRAKLQALYNELVCKEKVAKEYAKVAAGIGQGPTLPDYNRQSLKCIERIHTQIDNEANNMDFSYYLLACSTHASTEASSGSPGWCREFTSHDEMAMYVNKKSNFARVFAARTQGLSVAEVVAQTIGVNLMSSTEKARKTNPGDVVKAELAGILRTQFSALIAKDAGFPRAPDPVSILRDDFDIQIIQMPGSKLPSTVLKLGFNKMNTSRSLWLEDIKANLFKMEKINTKLTSEQDLQGDDTGGDDQVTMTQDYHQYHGLDDMEAGLDDELEDLDEGEEEEWNGIGYKKF